MANFLGWIGASSIVIVIWEILSVTYAGYIADPIEVVRYIFSVSFWEILRNVLITLKNSVIGFLIGLSSALLLTYFAFLNSYVDEIVNVFMILLQSVSALVWAIIFLMIFGILSPLPPMLVTSAASLPVLLSNLMEAMKTVDRKLLDVAKVFRIGKNDTFFEILLPASVPYIISGSRAAIGLALKLSVIAEAFGSSGGIGFMIIYNYDLADPRGVIAWALLLVILMVTLDRIFLKRLEEVSRKWRI